MKKKIIIFVCVVVSIVIFITGFSNCSSNNYSDHYYNDSNNISITEDITSNSTDSIEDYVSSVGEEVLQYPSENNDWEYDVYETYIRLKRYKGNNTVVNIPSKIESLPVKSIGSKCFNYDDPGVYEDTPPLKEPEFSEINIPNSIEVIEGEAFKGVQVPKLIIPNSVIYIDWYAFSYNKKLENITLPDRINTIRAGTFFNCTNLNYIKLPENLKEIQYDAFNGTGFETFVIPNSVETCGDQAFAYCSKLRSITISESLTSNGKEILKDCSNLKEIHFLGIEAGLNGNDLIGVPFEDLTIYGKSGSKAASLASGLGVKFVIE